MAIENRDLPVGTRLGANYKKTRYICNVETGEEEGSVVFVLEDGSRHKSPSSAGSRIMGGKAVNGWRFWTIEGNEPPQPEKPKAERKGQGQRKQSRTVFKTPNQQGLDEGKSRWFCSACMKAFLQDSLDQPEACPDGHRNDDLS